MDSDKPRKAQTEANSLRRALKCFDNDLARAMGDHLNKESSRSKLRHSRRMGAIEKSLKGGKISVAMVAGINSLKRIR